MGLALDSLPSCSRPALQLLLAEAGAEKAKHSLIESEHMGSKLS